MCVQKFLKSIVLIIRACPSMPGVYSFSRKAVKAERTMPDHSLYKCDLSEFDPCKMGEFFVIHPDLAFFISSCSILRLPSSITCTYSYDFASISLAVIALADFCGTTIGFASNSLISLIWRRVDPTTILSHPHLLTPLAMLFSA